MIAVDWTAFGEALRDVIEDRSAAVPKLERKLGISHATMHRALSGGPVGTAVFLTLCIWMGQPAETFTKPSGETTPLSTNHNSTGEA